MGDAGTDGRSQSSLGPFQFFTIGLGTMLGIAWAIMLGTWLDQAAPLGAVLGFVIGGLGTILIAMCYAELATALPRTGGDVIYILEVFGPRAAFVVGWFLVLMAISITSFEAISFAWFLGTLFPAIFGDGGAAAHLGVAIQIVGILAIATVNYRGARSSARLQDIFTVAKAGGAATFIIAAIAFGDTANLAPVLTPTNGKPFLGGALWIAATAPLWFGGFQVIPQAIEKRRSTTSLRTIGWITVATVVIGTIFYSTVVIAGSLALPWQRLVKAPLPAALAIDTVFNGSVIARIVLAAVVVGIIAAWNSCFLWATHLLLGMAGNGLLSPAFGEVNRFGAPKTASIVGAALGLLGLTLGREGLVPIVDMAAMSLGVSFALCCAATLRLRRTRPDMDRPFRVPGGRATMIAALLAAILMAAVSVLDPLLNGEGAPLELMVIGAWCVLGLLLWRAARAAPSRPLSN
ncbi:MAG: APC family permease [Sphingomonas bacterium]